MVGISIKTSSVNSNSSVDSEQWNLEDVSDSSNQPILNDQDRAPLLTFGVPVRNAETVMSRLLDSILAQDLQDFEIVICDNESSDRTPEICRAYAARDSRVRFYANPANIGSNQNFNRVLELARGKFFRWIGSDDWLEPTYASQCIAMFEQRPDAFGVTTYQDHTDDAGVRHYCEFLDRRPDSPYAHVRLRRMLWFMNADYRYIDPIYTMVRREALLKTHRLNMNVVWADQVLGAEMGLNGSFVHVPHCLAHRRVTPISSWQTCLKRWYHDYYDGVKHQTCFNVAAMLCKLVLESPLMNPLEKFLCLFPIVQYVWMRMWYNALFAFKEATRPLRKLVKWFLIKLSVMNELQY